MTQSKTATIALTNLAGKLTEQTGKPAPTYRKLWSLVVDGRLPTEKVNGRHFIADADLPAIARMLGLD